MFGSFICFQFCIFSLKNCHNKRILFNLRKLRIKLNLQHSIRRLLLVINIIVGTHDELINKK